MYAAGNHIGIEWDSATLAGAAKSWNSFGWGIAHEIGHNINQGSYAVAEITNNYFAQLMRKISDGTTRFSYDQVYKKVTSGTVGRSSSVMTQMAMYWQLYLAYGSEKNDGRIYDNYKEQFDNLFFARVDTYARNPEKAPKGGVSLNGGTDQNLMRLACAAAEKNILTFFERWGMVPDPDTKAYAEKFGDKETKAIYYVTDAVRDYQTDHKDREQADTILDRNAVTASVSAESDAVTITMRTDKDLELILGYEIIRSMISNGKKESAVIGFQPAGSASSAVFTDHVRAVNNRVLSYEVRAVDQFLNYSEAADAGSVKIQTDGVLDPSDWTIAETNLISDDDTLIDRDAEHPDSGYDAEHPDRVGAERVSSISRLTDLDRTDAGTYHESAARMVQTASITIDMHRTEAVTALKYQGSSIDSLTVEISPDGQDWQVVKKDDTGLKNAKETGTATVWFDAVKETERQNWIGTYDARYIRLTLLKSVPAAIQEIEICGPSGDNLEFLTTEGDRPAVGILKADYTYGTGAEDVIPKDSLVFTGTYKGNPAYNAVLLYDTEGNVIGAKDNEVHAHQVIFAPDPKDGNLGETSEGTWVYYVEKEYWDASVIHNLQGVRGELYRVDDAQTMEAERVVSDTRLIQIPSELKEITLTGSRF